METVGEDVLKIEKREAMPMVEEEVSLPVDVCYDGKIFLQVADVQAAFDSFHVTDLQNDEWLHRIDLLHMD